MLMWGVRPVPRLLTGLDVRLSLDPAVPGENEAAKQGRLETASEEINQYEEDVLFWIAVNIVTERHLLILQLSKGALEKEGG